MNHVLDEKVDWPCSQRSLSRVMQVSGLWHVDEEQRGCSMFAMKVAQGSRRVHCSSMASRPYNTQYLLLNRESMAQAVLEGYIWSHLGATTKVHFLTFFLIPQYCT